MDQQMALIGGEVAYRLLKRIAPSGQGFTTLDGSAFANKSKLLTLLGEKAINSLRGRVVVDFGCGEGHEVVELIELGAREVIGVDMLESMLATGRRLAEQRGVSDRARFTTTLDAKADFIVSLDAFEHFAAPADILKLLHASLQEGGKIFVSFGPTWYHPLGGHLFSVFPWAHLVFTEHALIRWRTDFKTDGATRFSEVAGGLNRMTIARFRSLVAASPLKFESFEMVPIRRLKRLHNALTSEFTTAIVRATLVHR